MRLLLDTHILLWALTDDPLLPSAVRTLILDESNEIAYSVASTWEVSIKHSLHPDRMKVGASQIVGFCEEAGFEPLPLCNRHVAALETLRRPGDAPRHNDPFDRIMVAQAKADNLLFVTHDALIAHYDEPCILPV